MMRPCGFPLLLNVSLSRSLTAAHEVPGEQMTTKRIGRWLAAALLLLAETAFSSEWKESFNGAGSGAERETACSQGESAARLLSRGACLSRRGERVDENATDCKCESIKNGSGVVFMCNATYKVTCRSRGTP